MPRKSKSRGDVYGPRGKRRGGLGRGRVALNEEVLSFSWLLRGRLSFSTERTLTFEWILAEEYSLAIPSLHERSDSSTIVV